MREKDEGNGWSLREILDPNTNKRHTQYFYKRKRAPRIELKDKVSQQLAAYTLIEKDLRNVLVWLDEIDRLHPVANRKGKSQIADDRVVFNVVKGLYVAALSFYGKCYTSCEGRRTKLEATQLNDEYQDAHKSVMHMRHNFAAHSGAENFEEVKIALVLYPNKKSDEQPRLYRELMQPDFMDSSDEDKSFKDLVNHVRNKVLDKIEKLEERIFEKEIAPKGKEYWYKKGK